MGALGARRTVRVASTKYDGSRHYEFDAQLLVPEGPMLTLLVPEGTSVTSDRGGQPVDTTFTALFWSDRDYDLYHNHRPMGRRRITSYANVELPAELDSDVLRWVDLDLDVIVDANGGVILDDDDEFEEHRLRFAYPDAIVARAITARDELLRLAAAGAFPFDRAAHIEGARGGDGGGGSPGR